MGKRLLHRCLRSGSALSLSSSPWRNIMSKSTKTQVIVEQLQDQTNFRESSVENFVSDELLKGKSWGLPKLKEEQLKLKSKILKLAQNGIPTIDENRSKWKRLFDLCMKFDAITAYNSNISAKEHKSILDKRWNVKNLDETMHFMLNYRNTSNKDIAFYLCGLANTEYGHEDCWFMMSNFLRYNHRVKNKTLTKIVKLCMKRNHENHNQPWAEGEKDFVKMKDILPAEWYDVLVDWFEDEVGITKRSKVFCKKFHKLSDSL